MHHLKKHLSSKHRRGAVAVEFAVIAPLLLGLVLGLIELTRAYDVQNLLQTAVREGARFAAMDRTGMLEEGESTNDKLIEDVTSFLVTSGLPADALEVTISDAENPGQPFDLDDPDNDLGMFRVDVSIPFSAVSYLPVHAGQDYLLEGSIVFRNGTATLSE
jgi:hypothetical protein